MLLLTSLHKTRSFSQIVRQARALCLKSPHLPEKSEDQLEKKSLQIPALLSVITDSCGTVESKINSLRTLGIYSHHQTLQTHLHQLGAINPIRQLLFHPSLALQSEAALCLYSLTVHRLRSNSLCAIQDPFIRQCVVYKHVEILNNPVFSQRDYLKLLIPLVNLVFIAPETIANSDHRIAAAKAIVVILSNYPSLKSQIFKDDIIPKIVHLLHDYDTRQHVLGRQRDTALLGPVSRILALLSDEQHLIEYCHNQLPALIEGLKHVLVYHVTYCQNPIHASQFDCETLSSIRLSVATCLENLANDHVLCEQIVDTGILRAMLQVVSVWSDLGLLRAIWALSEAKLFSKIVFEENSFDVILGMLLNGNTHARESLCDEFSSRLATSKQNDSLFFETITKDDWVRALSSCLVSGSLRQQHSVVRSLIIILNTLPSFHKQLLSHGLISQIILLVNNFRKQQSKDQNDELENMLSFCRSLCLFLSILSTGSSSHGYIYIHGGADILLSIFMDPNFDFISRKHAAVALANLMSNSHICSHVASIYSQLPAMSAISSGCVNIEEEKNDTDALCLSDILAAEAIKRRNTHSVIDHEVEDDIILALHTFLENDIYTWK